MRTFLAVSPPSEIALKLHAARAVLRDAWSGVRWVKPEHFHITLVFLGERDESITERVIDAVGPAMEDLEAFDVAFEGVGCFGSVSRPKIFIEKVGQGRDGLKALHEALRPVLETQIGWEERDYRPHLTLGRPRRRGLRGPAGGRLLPPGVKTDNVRTFRAREVTLYQSILHPEGVQYSRIESWPLKEAL